ncbi:MAG: tagaturonate reductase [Lachnospiraceae bacterium]|nr:tagaturonate reductase [Lachnospiraceae bacterium]
MERLTYKTIDEIGYDGYILKDAPERVLQFGEGNFLRAFTDHFIDVLNEKTGFNGKVVICQPRGGAKSKVINGQDGLYTLLLRGISGGKMTEQMRIISCISRCINPVEDFDELLACASNPNLRFITSNTTEAGIVYDSSCNLSDRPAASFPAKLTQFLYERYKADLPGFVILSCELIDRNGDVLLDCVRKHIRQWALPDEFDAWVQNENSFCSTLVDRIVTGYPKDEAEGLCKKFGYTDELMDAGEVYASWVIEGDKKILDELPFDKADLPVVITDNVDPFKKRKVRMLNGAHTSMSPVAFMSGIDTVGDCMKDPVISAYVKRALYDEIIPVLGQAEQKGAKEFAEAVYDRFSNPFIRHELLSILLNTTAKWKARVLPTITEYSEEKKALPEMLTFSFAAYIYLYHHASELTSEGLAGDRDGKRFVLSDDRKVLELFDSQKDENVIKTADAIMNSEDLWQGELLSIDGFTGEVIRDLKLIEEVGMYEAVKRITAANGGEGHLEHT